ncbi:hypothetical protein [Nostoc favosum]|uniref:Uncharacterized protein n=1 Tax=Nostoc favosum CHAB5714 TaxID=2780399 RepID=A0ABS8I318_9NOSO|nr:hypothetical protein [Nostoc favosum]MCC5598108.1 hypothetical protein [Nostoc favosum CHAB5714]
MMSQSMADAFGYGVHTSRKNFIYQKFAVRYAGVTKLNSCNHGERICYFGERICYFGERICYFGERICYFGERICYFGERICYFGERICYFGERICYFGERICYFGERICYFGVSITHPKKLLEELKPMLVILVCNRSKASGWGVMTMES